MMVEGRIRGTSPRNRVGGEGAPGDRLRWGWPTALS